MKHHLVLVLTVCLLQPAVVGFLFGQSTGSAPRAITVDDYFQIREVDDPQISADGQVVAYAVTTASLAIDKTRTQIWMVPAAGGEAIPLTLESASSSHPRWSPDGKYLAFLSARNDQKTQVWLLNRSGGEGQRLTNTAQDVENFEWSPDSTQLVVVLRDASPEELEGAEARVHCADPEDVDCKVKKEKAERPHVVDRYYFKEDEIGYLDRRRRHLYVFDIASKRMRQVTSGDFDDEEPAWSPDGKMLAFASKRSLPDPDRNDDANIWVVAADNTDKGAHLTQVTTNPGADRSPAWSPDGKSIAYVTQLEPKLYMFDTHHIGISPAGGGEAKVLTKALDRMASEPRFSPDGNFIYFILDDDGTQNLGQVPRAGGEVTRAIGGRLVVNAYTVSKTGHIAAQIATGDRPDEIFALRGGPLTRITHTNDDFMAQVKVSVPEYVRFKSKDGTTIAGYLYKPVDYVPGKRYPTILRLHGGPVWAYYAEFAHLPQLLAANQYVVLFPNPRGSSGYGEDYAKAIYRAWGDKDYQDDMAMVDYAIARGLADPEKLGVMGHSYGAISTDFIIAQTTRFKAAISDAGSASYVSMYGHDQYTRDYEFELGRPWENTELWHKISSWYRVEKITTPALFMGGEIDWNVPILGGEQMYQAMKSLGRETELVVYPGEYHEFKTPSHIRDRLERQLAWLAHYVKADGTPARPVEVAPAKNECEKK
jgi:dipeptidyl aminopeptidase/acylaminoacyl peptidase